jgi:hypothetical protein
MLDDEAIDEYQAIYQKQFGVCLPGKEAFEQALNLLNLYRAVYEPDPTISISQEHDEKIPSSSNKN